MPKSADTMWLPWRAGLAVCLLLLCHAQVASPGQQHCPNVDPVMYGPPDLVMSRTTGAIKFKPLPLIQEHRKYLDKIGQLFFGLPPPPAASQGFFGNLFSGNFLQNILGDGLDDDDSPSPSTPSIASSSHSQCTRPEKLIDLD